MPDIEATGTRLVAISPMLPKYTGNLVRKLELTFPLLIDPGNQVAERFGAVMTVPLALREIYLGFGIDLERFNGDSSWRLPLAGRIIIDRQGRIREVDLHPDHTTRPEPSETVKLLQSLTG